MVHISYAASTSFGVNAYGSVTKLFSYKEAHQLYTNWGELKSERLTSFFFLR